MIDFILLVLMPILAGFLTCVSIFLLLFIIDFVIDNAFTEDDPLTNLKHMEMIRYAHITQYSSFSRSCCSTDCSSEQD